MNHFSKQHGTLKLYLLLLLLAVAATGIVVNGLLVRKADSTEVSDWTQQRLLPTVSVVTPEQGILTASLQLTGRLQAYQQAAIFARVDGYIKDWYYDIGDKVARDDTLALLDTPVIDQQLLAAQADATRNSAELVLAEITLKRWQDLVASKAVSEQDIAQRESEYQAAKAQLEATQARVRQLEIQKSLAQIKAPFDGVITARHKDIGDLIMAGTASSEPLFQLATTEQLRLNVFVPQKYAARLSLGNTASLTVPDRPEKTFSAQITRSNTVVDTQSGTVTMQLLIDNPTGELLAGAYAKVEFPLSAGSPVLTVPASALIFNALGLSVAVVDAAQAGTANVSIIPVSIARDLGSKIEIQQGLTLKDQVIANPPDGISTGDRVRIVSQNNS